MEDIYKNSLILIHSLTQLNGACNKFYEFPTGQNGEKIIEIIDKCEEKFLKVKEEIAIMARVAENKIQPIEETIDFGQEVSVTETEAGMLINKEQL